MDFPLSRKSFPATKRRSTNMPGQSKRRSPSSPTLDFDKYTEDAVALFSATGITTVFENLEGFPKDWKTNPASFVTFVREHQCPSFLEYGEYPYVSADEVKKALKLKAAFSTKLDQMQ